VEARPPYTRRVPHARVQELKTTTSAPAGRHVGPGGSRVSARWVPRVATSSATSAPRGHQVGATWVPRQHHVSRRLTWQSSQQTRRFSQTGGAASVRFRQTGGLVFGRFKRSAVQLGINRFGPVLEFCWTTVAVCDRFSPVLLGLGPVRTGSQVVLMF
jgi:hypothetical protein